MLKPLIITHINAANPPVYAKISAKNISGLTSFTVYMSKSILKATVINGFEGSFGDMRVAMEIGVKYDCYGDWKREKREK
jgi:hypothetical protein